MKLIIDISEEAYNGIKMGMRNKYDMIEVGEAIENGIPLKDEKIIATLMLLVTDKDYKPKFEREMAEQEPKTCNIEKSNFDMQQYKLDTDIAYECGYKAGLKSQNNGISKAIPSTELKTGYWIEEDMFDGDVAYRCSECNELFWIESGTPKDNGYNFCPKCGKRLVEEQEGAIRNETDN